MKLDTGTSLRKGVFVLALAATACVSAVTTVAVAASGESEPGDATGFLRTVVAQIAGNDYGSAWQTLDPAQQRLVPEAQYVRCEAASPIPGKLASLTVVRASEARVVVAGGESGSVEARAVTFRLTITDPAIHDAVVVVHTVHAVQAEGRWAWILPPGRLELDRSSTCGTAASISNSHS